MREKLLQLEKVTKVFRRAGLGLVREKTTRALDEISLTMYREPTIVAFVGESGSGKTTVCRLILGLEKTTSGQILYEGRDVSQWLEKDWKNYRKEVQIVFQDPYGTYNPFYRVDRVLWTVIKKFHLTSSDRESRQVIDQSLEAVGLRPREILGRYPHQLSGGERQRIMLARIYLVKPNLLVCDEPVSMIDAALRAMFLQYLKDLKKLGISCLYITHDLNIAYYIADNVVILCSGWIVESGKTESVVTDPLHPYTKELISSIPNPDPGKRWTEKLDAESVGLQKLGKGVGEQGCIFYDRCRYAIAKCEKNRPPLLKTKGRQVACFLALEAN